MLNAQVSFSFLWFSYLAQWGPRLSSPERTDHHWRLHELLDTMAEVEKPFENTPEWDAFLDDIPGFTDYWSPANKYQMYRHHSV